MNTITYNLITAGLILLPEVEKLDLDTMARAGWITTDPDEIQQEVYEDGEDLKTALRYGPKDIPHFNLTDIMILNFIQLFTDLIRTGQQYEIYLKRNHNQNLMKGLI